MVKVLAKTVYYEPRKIGTDKIRLTLLERIEAEWSEHNLRKHEKLIDRMLVLAHNNVVRHLSSVGADNKYVFSEVEAPGLRAIVGEGQIKDAETLLFLKPEPVTRVVVLRRNKETGMLEKITEINVSKELWGYETKIELPEDMEWDALLVESPERKRLILKEEIKLPLREKIVEPVKPEARRKKHARKKKTKSVKKKKKKRTKKKRKKRRKK